MTRRSKRRGSRLEDRPTSAAPATPAESVPATPAESVPATPAESAPAAATSELASPAAPASTGPGSSPLLAPPGGELPPASATPVTARTLPDDGAASGSASGRAAGHGLTGFYLHLHPPRVRRRSLGVTATLGLGLATAVALALTTLSGLLLMIHYVPSLEQAHASVQDLISLVPLGRFIRNLHRWAGHAAVLFALLHLLRTFLWGAYGGAHRRVWLLGVGLLLLIMATSYSGYLLPWDQDAYWTVTVGTSLAGYTPLIGDWLKELLLGADSVGQPALTRFYVLHVALLPALGLVLGVLHLFRLRRAGGLARPPGATGPGEELVPASPGLTGRELALGLSITILLCAAALVFDARLGPAPDLLRPDDPPKAPWFLVGIQELVSYSAVVGGVLFPLLLFLLLALLPWLDGAAHREVAPLRPPASGWLLLLSSLVAAAAALVAVLWWGDPQAGRLTALNPASLAALAASGAALLAGLLRRSRALAVQSLLAALLAALLIFTAIGWFWRGPEWKLVYHPGPGHGAAALEAAPEGPR